MAKKRIVVVGAGFGGLSAAAYLARDGFEVTIYEKNDQPGGRAMVIREGGFTFDAGPSWYLMPDVFEEFFASFGKRTSDYYRLVDLYPSYRVFSAQKQFDVQRKPDVYTLFDELEPGSGKRLAKLLDKTEREYNTVREGLLELDGLQLRQGARPQVLKMLLNPELNRSYHGRVKKYVKNPELQKVLEFMAVFMGGSPETIPALYSLLAHVDMGLGVKYPMGGFGELARL